MKELLHPKAIPPAVHLHQQLRSTANPEPWISVTYTHVTSPMEKTGSRRGGADGSESVIYTDVWKKEMTERMERMGGLTDGLID